jgi:Rv0078B-related antitoxin
VKNPAVERLTSLIEPLPEVTTAQRLRATLRLSQAGLEMKRQQFVREFPGEDKAQILQRMVEWQCQRKEAPTGDFPGPTRELT